MTPEGPRGLERAQKVPEGPRGLQRALEGPFRENHKKLKIMIIIYFFFIFCIFLKNRKVELSFQCRNEFYMPKYPNNRIFMGFGEKSGFSSNFWPYYSMAIWRLWAPKLINTISAEYSLFPSKNHDSIAFMQFC